MAEFLNLLISYIEESSYRFTCKPFGGILLLDNLNRTDNRLPRQRTKLRPMLGHPSHGGLPPTISCHLLTVFFHLIASS